LVLEVTETSIIANLEGTKSVIEELRDLGVVVSIDDFGAGFTSLAYLSDLAVGELKLDGVFIIDLAPGTESVTSSSCAPPSSSVMRWGCGSSPSASRTRDTLDLLSELGCDLGQGYFIGRPLPADRTVLPTGAR
jgi:EAL domain-containing protein (putative c-di-GMP-specific phosphodiesterase class I)